MHQLLLTVESGSKVGHIFTSAHICRLQAYCSNYLSPWLINLAVYLSTSHSDTTLTPGHQESGDTIHAQLVYRYDPESVMSE